MSPSDPQDRDRLEVGLVKLLGVRVEEASGDRVVLSCPVTPDLHQPFGLVHGGVHATLAETAASVGGALWFGDRGVVVGVSNHTDFLRAVREGELRAEATPLARGRTSQLWQVEISDGQGRLVAHAKVRLQNLAEEPGAGPPGA
ncbi:MAG TPA: PaaI family thioesterase [Actinomycetota bacterium]|nr:PaaI family thioesterase [Actinomycetota bacterium]